jgi:NADPH2:quinone reductase
VLVHGAAGGVGLAAVDLAKALGARVIAASASDAKLAAIQALYAPDAVVNVTGGFRDRVKEITGGRGADVIYDPVGGDVFDESVRCIAFNGRLLVIGFTSGRIPTVSVNMPLIKGFSVMGVRAGEYGRQFPEKGRENAEAVWRMADEGVISPHVHAALPLDRWREAFALLANRQVIGKAVLRPDL